MLEPVLLTHMKKAHTLIIVASQSIALFKDNIWMLHLSKRDLLIPWPDCACMHAVWFGYTQVAKALIQFSITWPEFPVFLNMVGLLQVFNQVVKFSNIVPIWTFFCKDYLWSMPKINAQYQYYCWDRLIKEKALEHGNNLIPFADNHMF